MEIVKTNLPMHIVEKKVPYLDEKGVLDFNDLEHLALQILTEKTKDAWLPSEASKHYRKKFKEVGEFPQMLESEPYQIEVTHIRQEEFDHGGTRNMGASISQADIVLYMTQDAIPADNRLTERFVEVFKSNPEIGIA